MSYLGLMLPDIFALVLVALEANLSSNVREIISRNLLLPEPREQWSTVNAIVRDMKYEFFIDTFFIPGSVTLVSFIGLILESPLVSWIILTLAIVVLCWVADISFCLMAAKRRLSRAILWHRVIVIIFILFTMAAKVAIKMRSQS